MIYIWNRTSSQQLTFSVFSNYVSFRSGKGAWHSICKSQLWNMFYSTVSCLSSIQMDAKINIAHTHTSVAVIESVLSLTCFYWKNKTFFRYHLTFQKAPELSNFFALKKMLKNHRHLALFCIHRSRVFFALIKYSHVFKKFSTGCYSNVNVFKKPNRCKRFFLAKYLVERN